MTCIMLITKPVFAILRVTFLRVNVRNSNKIYYIFLFIVMDILYCPDLWKKFDYNTSHNMTRKYL